MQQLQHLTSMQQLASLQHMAALNNMLAPHPSMNWNQAGVCGMVGGVGVGAHALAASKMVAKMPGAPNDGADKNKNCHFCEHAPKRCAIFACLDPVCDQMFCENCCKRHLNRPTSFKGQHDACAADWRCPIWCVCGD